MQTHCTVFFFHEVLWQLRLGHSQTGLVPFAIGSETAGSITFPASRCGVTALRPTFGTVGRTGVMSISESLVIS